MADLSRPHRSGSAKASEYAAQLAASTTHPLVATAIANMRLQRDAIQQEQTAVLAANKTLWHTAPLTAELSGEGLAKKVKSKAAENKHYLTAFTTHLKTLPAEVQNTVPLAVRYNKMDLVINGADAQIWQEDETAIVKLADGHLPCAWSYADSPMLPPILGEQNAFWGTSRVTYLSYAALAVNFALTNRSMQDLPLDSAITHIAPLPQGLYLDPNCSFAYNTDLLAGFGYVHSGYSFGGYRFEESLYPHGKTFGPEDCSSWLAKLTGCTTLFTTLDQLYNYRLSLKTTAAGETVPAEWQNSRTARNMLPKYTAVALADLRPGDIYLSRTFPATQDPQLDTGSIGHTALIFSINRKESLAVTLGLARDMPNNLEGFGLQEFALDQKRSGDNIKVPLALRML